VSCETTKKITDRTATEDPKSSSGPIHAAVPLHHLCMGPQNHVTMCNRHSWSILGGAVPLLEQPWVKICMQCSLRAGQLRETQNPALGPSTAAVSLHHLCMGPQNHVHVTMCNRQFMVHIGWCCASFGAALGENLHAATEWDSYGRPKIQIWALSSAAVPLHHL
jgi:hypothetical protein